MIQLPKVINGKIAFTYKINLIHIIGSYLDEDTKPTLVSYVKKYKKRGLAMDAFPSPDSDETRIRIYPVGFDVDNDEIFQVTI